MSLNYSNDVVHVKHGTHTIINYPIVCIHYEEEVRLHSIFLKENPLKFIFPVFMAQIILEFILSQIVQFVFRPLRQTKFVCSILAGIILGPSVLGRNTAFIQTIFPPKEMVVLNTLATFGTTLFVFLMAVKVDTSMLLKTAKTAWTISLSTYFISFAVTLSIQPNLKKYLIECIGELPPFLLSGSLSSTFLPIIAHVLEEQNLLTTELGQLSLTSAMLMETLTHSLLVVGSIFMKGSFLSSVKGIIIAYAPVFFAIYVIRPVMLQIIKRTPQGRPVNEIYVVLVFVVVFMMIVVANVVWGIFLPMAFLMGLIIPDGPPLGATLVEKSELLIMKFFMPLFFIQVGYQSDLSSITNTKTTWIFLFLLIISYTAKMLGTLLPALCFNIKLKNAIFLGIILNFKGIIDLTTYQRWRIRQVLSTESYTVLVLFNVSFIAFLSPLIKIFYDPHVRLIESLLKNSFVRTLHSTPQDMELRVLTCIHHEDNVRGIINLLEASSCKSTNSSVCAYVINVVELVGRTLPLLTRHNSHKMRLKNTNSDHIVRAFKNYSKNSNGFISIIPFTMVAPYKTMHNIICNLAEDKLVPFIIAPFHINHEVCGLQTNLLRDFNDQLQANASCTVGILVEKGSEGCPNKLCEFSYNVMVLFAGGVDDREALALAIRMSCNPNVNITIVRINSDEDNNFSESGRQLDDSIFKEFKEKNLDNNHIVFRDPIANDSIQMLHLIKSLEQNYDLAIVGRNSNKMQFEKEMVEWVEYPELGVIGDMLFSLEEFRDSTMSILVMQHCRVDIRY